MSMTKIKESRLVQGVKNNKGRTVKIVAAVLATLLVISAFAVVFVKLDELTTTERIGISIFETGDIVASDGTLKDSKTALRTEKFITTDGLKVEVADDASVSYSIIFYTEDGDFVSALVDMTDDFEGENIPVAASQAKIVVRNAAIEGFEFNAFNRAEYLRQLTITVNKD